MRLAQGYINHGITVHKNEKSLFKILPNKGYINSEAKIYGHNRLSHTKICRC